VNARMLPPEALAKALKEKAKALTLAWAGG
jgi:hypothetical protein